MTTMASKNNLYSRMFVQEQIKYVELNIEHHSQ